MAFSLACDSGSRQDSPWDMAKPLIQRRTLCLVLLGITACGGARHATQGRRDAHPAPKWFATAQGASDPRYLYFVGSTNAADDESSARDLAVQKALHELSVYCGATLTTDFNSIEVQKNGELNREVALTVSVAGEEVSIQEATADKWSVGRGSDRRYDAYVRLKWPRRQFDKVRAAQRAKARQALSLYLKAEAATDDYRMADAKRLLREARQSLGPTRGQTPLDHPKYQNSGLVFDAAEALADRIRDIEKQRRGVIAVSVTCRENDAAKTCASRWVGKIRQRVTQTGLEIASQPVSRPTAAAILDSQSPQPDAALRASSFVLAVKYDARLSSTEGGFIFARCGARGVMFDTDQKDVLSVTEVKPQKGGHVNFEGAVKKGCAKAETRLIAWIDQTVAALKERIK